MIRGAEVMLFGSTLGGAKLFFSAGVPHSGATRGQPMFLIRPQRVCGAVCLHFVVHGADLLHFGNGTWSQTVHGVAIKHRTMYDLLVTSFSFLLACIIYNTSEFQAHEKGVQFT
jgi:hypothetical protein